eukprot:CAMPEP_0117074410 /NCGR_PEP_ID=MMETSP0472-20121206/52423_1 /TAXON_ID=693140 ORGANISM="Tiarina fusus, Strain LIS" /NCGR_SAMPLE_ID=MMETSP0472 /ASSEMBLY_ACC=CAM_ASM_000603 /LENGTH=290 /DNA_ID=CAMNT_0004799417 /DNA_START=239 /DNA_END=1108 /DNA_ORIENTATION=-
MLALARASDSDKKSETKYRKSSSGDGARKDQMPGAVPISGSGNHVPGRGGYSTNNSNKTTIKHTKRRGVDIDDTDTPEEEKAKATQAKATLGRGQDYDSTEAPPPNYRARRAAAQNQVPDDEEFATQDDYSDDDDGSTPGAMNVPGVGRANTSTTRQQSQHDGGGPTHHHGLASVDGMDGDFITAHLVEEGTVDPMERDQIRREAQEELINDAAKAEIAEPVDNRKWYICACVATVVVVGAVVGAVLATRADPPPVINNSYCEESKPIEIGSVTAGSTRDSNAVDANTCI